MKLTSLGKRPRSDDRRRGSALAEFAVISPLLITILLGIVEFGYMFMLRQVMTNAAREGCRLSILNSSSEETVLARVDEVMSGTGITGYDVNYSKGTDEDPVDTVEISINYDDVTLLPGFFAFMVDDITSSCTMRQEGV